MEKEKNKGVVPNEIVGEGLSKAVGLVWPESQIIQGDYSLEINPLSGAVVFCPLYGQGPLENSRLINSPLKFSDSRVYQKNLAYSRVISGVSQYIASLGGEVVLKAVFADRGVLLGKNPDNEDLDALNYHKRLYGDFIVDLCVKNGIRSHNLQSYEDLSVEFPKFVDPRLQIPQDDEAGLMVEKTSSKIIGMLNKHLGLPFEILDNKRSRKVIERVMGMNGIDFNAAFWLIGGYLAFDYKIASMIGKNGLYLASERFDPLFYISKLTPSLDGLTRVQIKA